MTTTPHAYRRNLITVLLLSSIAIICILFSSCKKQVVGTEKKPIPKYWKVVEFDFNLQTTSTPIFWNSTGKDAVNDWDDDTDNWPSWSKDKRKKWCDNHNPQHQKHYCDICELSPLCKPTPVNFLSWSIADNIVKWQTATEQNVDYFSIQGSFDGNLFTEMGRTAPQGPSKYSFNLIK